MSSTPPPSPKKNYWGGGKGVGNKTEGSNTIMSTSFALKLWYNKLIDVDIILSITLTVSYKLLFRDFIAGRICAEIGAFFTILACFKPEFLLFWTIISKKYGTFFYLKCPNSCRENHLSIYIHIIFSY